MKFTKDNGNIPVVWDLDNVTMIYNLKRTWKVEIINSEFKNRKKKGVQH